MRSEGKLNEVGRKRDGPALYKHISAGPVIHPCQFYIGKVNKTQMLRCTFCSCFSLLKSACSY
jgi:hypothetical protein